MLAQVPGPLDTSALLWDLDNVVPRRQHLASLAEVMCCLVKPDQSLIAAAHRTTFRSCQETLASLGIEVLSGGRRRNGADRVLLDRARALNEQGVERFLVASNDHRFARIASLGELHVLTLQGANLSERLRAAAATVTVLERGDHGWRLEPSRAKAAFRDTHLPTRQTAAHVDPRSCHTSLVRSREEPSASASRRPALSGGT
jgi:hypothetical protein